MKRILGTNNYMQTQTHTDTHTHRHTHSHTHNHIQYNIEEILMKHAAYTRKLCVCMFICVVCYECVCGLCLCCVYVRVCYEHELCVVGTTLNLVENKSKCPIVYCLTLTPCDCTTVPCDCTTVPCDCTAISH